MIMNFSEYFESKKKLTVFDKITDDPNEYVAHDRNKFIDQDVEIDKITPSKPTSKKPLNKNDGSSKPIFNTAASPNL